MVTVKPPSHVAHRCAIQTAAPYAMVLYRNTQQDLLGIFDILYPESLVEQIGLEPISPDFQSVALTIFATVPFFARQLGLEPKPYLLER